MNLGERRETLRPIGLILDSSKCTPDIVCDAVCFYYDISLGMLSRDTRVREVVVPRQMLHYFLTMNHSISMNQIAHITNRDHATVSSSRKKIEEFFTIYPKVCAAIHTIAFYINWLYQLDMEVNYQTINPGQIRYMYFLLDNLGIRHLKEDLVGDASGGRTTSARELKYPEMLTLISHLEDKLSDARREAMPHKVHIQQADRMRKRILSMCYSLGWTRFDPNKSRHTVDMDRLTAWLQKYGYLHKDLGQYTYLELPTLVSQFENLLRTTLSAKTTEKS